MSRTMVELAAATAFVTPLNGRRAHWLKSDTFAGGTAAAFEPAPAPSRIGHERHVRHDRDLDFGIGYGNSSGYATDRHYVSEWLPRGFRCH